MKNGHLEAGGLSYIAGAVRISHLGKFDDTETIQEYK
jgi:hypothetical protein